MRRAVLKQRLTFGKNTLFFPKTSHVRHVHAQQDKLTIWYEADPSYEEERRIFHVLATGQDIPEAEVGFYNAYIGTIHLLDGTVWHVYEVRSNGF